MFDVDLDGTVAVIVDGEFLVFIESQILALHITQLVVYDDGADDEHGGDRELEDDEDLAHGETAFCRGETPLEHGDGIEAGHDEGGIDAGNGADADGDAE